MFLCYVLQIVIKNIQYYIHEYLILLPVIVFKGVKVNFYLTYLSPIS